MTTRKAVAAKPAALNIQAPSTRRPWVKRTTVEVVLDQIGKQEKKVAEMRAAIAHEERELAKLQEAKKVLEAK